MPKAELQIVMAVFELKKITDCLQSLRGCDDTGN